MKITSVSTLVMGCVLWGVATAFSAPYSKSQGQPSNYGNEEMMLMDIEVVTGETGGFGAQLERLKLAPYVHGYAVGWFRTNDFNRNRPVQSFDLQYFNVIVGVKPADKVVAEVMLDYEHSGEEMGLRYGMIDYTPVKHLTIRTGKFLVPVGKFNEYYYPEYINKLADRPFNIWTIVPSVWSEVGVQLRGNPDFGAQKSLSYAFFIVNGLEGAEGADVRNMRENSRDSHSGNKGYGGRVGFSPWRVIETGASFYTGAYTKDAGKDLAIRDIDFEYKGKKLTVRSEYSRLSQDVTGDVLKREGFYIEPSYRVNSHWEPVVRYDLVNREGVLETVQRATFGVVLYPEPQLIPRFSFKVNYSHVFNNRLGKTDREVVAQTAIGF